MSRDAVCKRGGLTGNTITHVEEGLKVEPRWEIFRRFAKGLNVELDDLVRLGIDLAPGGGLDGKVPDLTTLIRNDLF